MEMHVPFRERHRAQHAQPLDLQAVSPTLTFMVHDANRSEVFFVQLAAAQFNNFLGQATTQFSQQSFLDLLLLDQTISDFSVGSAANSVDAKAALGTFSGALSLIDKVVKRVSGPFGDAFAALGAVLSVCCS